MTVILADTRTIVHEFDSTTGLSSPVAAEALTLFTADPNPIEASGSIGMAVSIETSEIVATIASVDLSAGVLIYIWALANGTMDNLLNGGVQGVVGDGTNTIGFHLAGSNKAAFRYNDGEVAWQCLILDTSSLPATTTDHRGVAASLVQTAITEFGAAYKTLSKALGGASNCFTDIIRYGNNGLIVTGGGIGTEGNFDEIAIADRSTLNQIAYGIAHEVASGVFGLQGPLTFGDNVGTAALDFLSQNETIVFEDRGIGTDKYFINVVGNATGATRFQLGEKVGTDGGANGSSITCPAGVGASLDASDINIDEVLIYGSSISGFNLGVDFSSDATNAPNHEVFASTFSGCGQVDPGLINFSNNTIAGTTDANGGYLGNRDVDKLTFTSDGTGHAIYITTPGTYDYTNNSFGGYGADGTTDAVIFNDSGGAVTINVNSGDTPTFRNGAGASTTIIAGAVTTTAIVSDQITKLPIQGVAITVTVGNTVGGLPFKDSVTITRTGDVATVTHTAHGFTTGAWVEIEGADQNEYNRLKQITVTGVNSYTFNVLGSPTTPATGTITSTAVIINGLTDVNGEIGDTRVFPVSQDVTGFAAKGTTSPLYKRSPISTIIDKDNGVDISILMVSDE